MNIKIALCSLNPTVGDIEGNSELIIEAYQQAVAEGAEIVLTPEMSLTGYPLEDLTLKPAFIAAVMAAKQRLCDRIAALGHKAALVFGHPSPAPVSERNRDLVYNSATFVDPEANAIQTIHKHELPNYGVFDEKRNYLEGPLSAVIPWRGIKLGLMICEDGWFPDVAAHLAVQGADILLWINGSPFAMGKNLQRLQHAANRMNDTGLPLCYVNLVGGQDELVFDGHSFACDGGTFVETGIFKTGMQIVSMKAGPDRSRIGLPALQPWVNKPTGIGEAYQAKVLGVRDYLQKQGFASVVIGMSGGIDSAAVASICVDAIGPENVHLVRLPSRFSSGGSLADAEKARVLLGCPMRTIEIEPMVAAIRAAYSGAHWDIPASANPGPDQLTGIADENIQARARGLILMAISNQEGHMLLTTGNKSEVAVGYSTLYGDMCGGYNGLKDLYKTEVSVAAGRDARDTADVTKLVEAFGPGIVQWRNGLDAKSIDVLGFKGPAGRTVPVEIECKAESAELAEGQRDSDSLPLYPVLDAILKMLVDHNAGTEATIAPDLSQPAIRNLLGNAKIRAEDANVTGFLKEDVDRVNKLLNRAEYKRRQAAPGPKVGAMIFGRDRRIPIVNGWKG